jgi:2',3'-cyclic-nucleotide 2'-phosphodiesterase (5'-nucleotidase family)
MYTFRSVFRLIWNPRRWKWHCKYNAFVSIFATLYRTNKTLLPAFFVAFIVVSLPSVSAQIVLPAPSAQVTLTILHDNDIHGHLFPFAYVEKGISPLEQPSRGGAARRATFVRQLRREIHNPVFLVDTGDIATRGPLATTYQGIADVEAMNGVGYDLAAIGNNEFKLKDAVDSNDSAGAQADLLDVIKRSRFPWICANVTESKGAFLEGVEPYVVRDFNGVRVGFLGLTAPRSAAYSQTKGWTISDPISAAQEWIPEARKHCDVLIAMTHIGVDEDELLAAQTTGIDAIIGGDSHTFLYKPVVVKNPDGYSVPIVQDGEFGADIGRFDLKLAEDASGHWSIAGYKDVLMPIGPKLNAASDVNATLEPFLRPFKTVVGQIGPIASTPAQRTQQTDQIIVNAMKEQLHSDIAINPSDGDADLYNVFRHSAVTRYDVFAILPFHDNGIVARLTGSQIKAILKLEPDATTAGDIADLTNTTVYSVAVVDYVGTNVFKIPDSAFDQSTGRDIRDVVIGYLHDEPVSP